MWSHIRKEHRQKDETMSSSDQDNAQVHPEKPIYGQLCLTNCERPEVKDGEDLGLCKSEYEDSAKLGESDPGEDGAAHVHHSLPRVLHL